MQLSWIILEALLCAASTSATPLHALFANPSNQWNASTTIAFPNSAPFGNATARWNTFMAPTYSVVITPASAKDVATAVKLCRSNNIDFLATGGRHSSTVTLGQLDNGVAIDLSGMNSVSMDGESGLLTVGGGVRFGEVVEPVHEAGYSMPLGSCSCPGMVGASLGGGVGRYQGIDGMIIDTMDSVQMVTADGELITASKDTNADLFWAVAGAGANFGVITSATYRVPKQTNNGMVLNADLQFPASVNRSYFDIIESLQDTMPPELATATIIYYNDTVDDAHLLANWVYIGPEDEGREWLAPILALNPSAVDIQYIPYNKIYSTALGGLGNTVCTPVHEWGFSANTRNLSSSTFQKIFTTYSDFYAKYPDGRASGLELEVFAPQAVRAVPVDATPYPWRDTLGYGLISFLWNSTETKEAGHQTALDIRADIVATSGWDDLKVYVSYAHGDETPEQAFGSNLPRLVDLKRLWDPDNVFRFFMNLPRQ